RASSSTIAGVTARYEPTYEGLKPVIATSSTSATFSGYEPTYEGLKRWRTRRSRGADRGYEPTYEGLKPNSSGGCSERTNGYEPTYEGLKHAVVESLKRRGLAVTSLPMRD
ncbi:MAG: hypothetical protein NZ741_13485, partial [Armatimonadetes bacterium]|nr:hypothetical protein [Armatimonadota bacterium]